MSKRVSKKPLKELRAAAGKKGGSVFAGNSVDAKTARMLERWVLRYYDEEGEWPSRWHAHRVKGIGHALWSRVKRSRRRGGKGLIEKVPETPVKGTKKRAVHTPEKEKRHHIERANRQGSGNAGERKYRQGSCDS